MTQRLIQIFPPRGAPFNSAIFVAVSAVTRVEANDSAITVAFRKRSIVVNKVFSGLTIKEGVLRLTCDSCRSY